MRFQVPQFINVEDRIFGPFTAKQFVYLAGGAGICFVIYKLVPLFIAIIIIAPIVLLSIALAFVKINQKPFVFVLEAAIKYYLGSKLFLWRKEPKEPTPEKEELSRVESADIISPGLSESKLKEIAWSLDVNKNTKDK